MSLKTRNIMDGSELREGIGLQYFAEGETGADMDGFDGGAFLESLTGENGLENQQAAAPDGGAEGEEGGLENQQTDPGQQGEPETLPPEGGETPPEEAENQPVQTVPLVYNGQQILLPADAVQALTGALGANPVELLQKGMNYDAIAALKERNDFMLTTLIPTLAASSIWWALAIHDYIETMRGYEIEDEPEPIEIKRSLPPTEHKKEMIQVKSERHCSVIDAKGEFVTFVLVQTHDQTNERGETESVQEIKSYSLKDGEQLVDASPPVMRQHAGSTGFLSPIWDGSQWAETAAADEIAAWEKEHPAPEVKPAPKSNAELEAENATLRQQVSALADQQSFYEDCIAEMAEVVYA